MNLIEAGLKYRKITFLLFVALIIAGVSGFTGLPRYEDPQFKVSMANVITPYPGATPEQVEALVTRPLEEEIKTITGVGNIFSSSSSGLSSITVELEDDADLEKGWEELHRMVGEARGLLPPGAAVPEVNDELNRTSFMILHLVAPPGQPATALRTVADLWENDLRRVPEVERVDVAGLPGEEVQLIVEAGALAARGLSWAHVADAVQKRHVNLPAGTIREGRSALLTEPPGEYRSLDEIRNTVIYRSPGGALLKMEDVARVVPGPGRVEELIKTGGRPSVALTLFAKEGRSVIRAEEQVRERLQELASDLPPGVEAVVAFNLAESTREKFAELGWQLLFGMGMVLVVCLAGFSWRVALIVPLVIPASFAIGFAVLPALGVALHQITIAGLIIVLGILVDDTIVVNDNISRHLAAGGGDDAAVLSGVREVTAPVVLSTVAVILGFLPLLLLPGDIGDYIAALPVTVSVVMSASTAVALWLVPILNRRFVQGDNAAVPAVPSENGDSHDYRDGLLGPFLERLGQWYAAGLTATLRRPGVVLAAALVVGAGAPAAAVYRCPVFSVR